LFSNSKAEVFSELKDDSPSCLILDIDETSKTFNWKPKIKISEGIRRLLE
jgi:nucleoside-diphosphate-sugar epimerase